MIRTVSASAPLLLAALLTAAPAFADGTPGLPGGNPSVFFTTPPPRITQHLSGTIRLNDCNAGTADLHVRIDGRSLPVTADDQGLTYRYTVDGIATGPHTIVPEIDPARCPGGSWSPGIRTINVAAATVIDDADFHFAVARRTQAVTRSQFRALGSAVFSGLRIHLNNHDPIAAPWRTSYLNRGDSFVRFSGDSPAVHFDIPEQHIAWGTGTASYYVNNLDSYGRALLDLDGGLLKASFFMRGDGTSEILAYQQGASIVTGPPNVHIAGIRIDVYLHPARDVSGRLTYDDAKVQFSGRISGDGLYGALADAFAPGYHEQIAASVESRLREFLDRPETRESITTSLQSQLALLGIGYVTGVQLSGDQIVLEYHSRV